MDNYDVVSGTVVGSQDYNDYYGVNPTLIASTGKNDSSSPWGQGLLNFFTSALPVAGNTLTTLNQTNAQKKLAAQQAKKSSGLTGLILPAVVGLVIVVVLVVLVRRGR